MNTPVSFELAKLLKEKGFSYGFGEGQKFYFPETKELTENHRGNNYPAPTVAEVVMWLYEKHGIWIWAERYSTLFRPYAEEIGDERFGKWEGYKYSSPTKAYEAAIEYTLNNLI